MPIFTAQQLKEMGTIIFQAAGSPREEAAHVSEFLVNANLTGHDSHGVINIRSYVGRALEGKIIPGALVEIIKETPTTALVDGHWGYGQVVGVKAMEIAIRKAQETNVSAVAIRRCNHIGRAGDYPAMALEHDMVGITMCNAGPVVAPFGGAKRMLGTSPMAFAIPAGKERPYILDMATSVCAEGKLRVRLNRGEKTPDGYIIDKNGNPTNSPQDFYDGGAILPLGGPYVGYKGYGLGLLVEILGGILSGAGVAWSPQYAGGNGTFMMAINIGAFIPIDEFKAQVDEMIRVVKATPLAPGAREILVPGEPEFRTQEERLRHGIYVEDRTVEQIMETAQRVGVADQVVGVLQMAPKAI